MALRKTSILKGRAVRGFSLIEVVIVLGMLTIVGGLGLIVSMDTFRSYSFRDERDVIVSALQKARNQAVNNMCFGSTCADGKSHGVKIVSTPNGYQYVIFQGSYYHDTPQDQAVDEVIASVYRGAVLSGFTEVVFAPLSGNASTTPRTLSVSEAAGSNSSVITVGVEGQIFWTR